jgi:hypothetical protein
MRATPNNSLTQDELVAELHRRGYSDITARRVADWRVHDLLPPFNMIGGGRGQRKGREQSRWMDRDLVINQAIRVCELLPNYRSLDELRVPLWMLGYPVPADQVRQALREPLDSAMRPIKEEIASSGEMEDLIDDIAYDLAQKWGRVGMELFQIPQETTEAFINVLFNEDYDLSDAPFKEGVMALQEYERRMQDQQAAAFAARGIQTDVPQRGSSLGDFFKHAPLIKEYFSLPRLKRAVEESTDDDWRAVERDVNLLREMALLAHRMFKILIRDLDPKFDTSPASTLPPLFTCGKVLIWIDLSLRRHGYSELIDLSLAEAMRCLREKCDEKLERELAEVSPVVASTINSAVEIMIDSFRPSEGANKQAGGQI